MAAGKTFTQLDEVAFNTERGLLGAVLIRNETLGRVNGLRPNHFGDPRHRATFAAMQAISEKGRPIDALSMEEQFVRQGSLEAIGGLAFISELLSAPNLPDLDSVGHWADAIESFGKERALRNNLGELVNNPRVGPDELAARARTIATTYIGDDSPTDAITTIEWISTVSIFEPLPPTPWLSRELGICPGRPTMIAGYGYSGKTLGGQSILLAVSSGTRLWGYFPATAAQRVRHLDFEQGRHATLKRYQRLAAGMNLSEMDIEPRLEVAIFPPTPLNGPNAADVYARASEDCSIVMLDSLAGATPGEEENDSRMRGHLDMLGRASEKTGATFLVIHHSGKPKEGRDPDDRTLVRGHSAIFDACGSVLVFVGNKSAPVQVKQIKAPAEAEGKAIEPFFLNIEDVEASAGYPAGVRVSHKAADAQRDEQKVQRETADDRRRAARQTKLEGALPEKMQEIWAAIRNAAPGSVTSQRQMAALVKGDTNLKQDAVARLLADGRVRKAAGGGYEAI